MAIVMEETTTQLNVAGMEEIASLLASRTVMLINRKRLAMANVTMENGTPLNVAGTEGTV